MADHFAVGLPLETAWTRRLLCAAEVLDAVTLRPVGGGVRVRAEGLSRKPFLNASGHHCWLEEDGAQPLRIIVDALNSPYADAESAPPVPPARSIRIELSPRASYPFPQGATVLRGTLRERRFGDPEPIAGARVRLQWSDGAAWVNSPIAVATDEKGAFAAPLRLAPKQEPRVVDGDLAMRLQFDRAGSVRTSPEIRLKPGRVTGSDQPFIWDELNP